MAVPPKGVRKRWWQRPWVPCLAVVGDLTCIDLDPTRAGVCGQVFVCVHDGGPERVVAPSYAALFADFARELSEGRYAVKVNTRGDAYLDRLE